MVQFGGDSGSTCFYNGFVTGVASYCTTPSYYDHNNNDDIDAWDEVYDVPMCWRGAK